MQVINEQDAREAWFNDGFTDIFTFDEYVNLLERTHVYVIRDIGNKGEMK